MIVTMIRHGETDWNKGHRFQGRIDIPLNDYGRALAVITRDAMPYVPYDRVYCSPLCRAVETAHILLQGRPEEQQIRIDDRIIEFGFGEFEGSNIEEAGADPSHPMYNMLHHPESFVPAPGGESFHDLLQRCSSFLRDEILPLEGQCEQVLIVAHGALIRGMVCAAGHKEVKDFWGCRYFNCCVTTLEVKDSQIALLREAHTYYDSTGAFGGWKK